MLLAQLGGGNGELAAAMQYAIRGLNCEDAKRKDMLLDIGTEDGILVACSYDDAVDSPLGWPRMNHRSTPLRHRLVMHKVRHNDCYGFMTIRFERLIASGCQFHLQVIRTPSHKRATALGPAA